MHSSIRRTAIAGLFGGVLAYYLLSTGGEVLRAQTTPQTPRLVNNQLTVRAAVSGLTTPTSIAMFSPNEMFVIEKSTGSVKYVTNGTVQSTVLNLAVNNSSERGLLGIALHPDFPVNRGVYLYWTCSAPPPPAENPHTPTQTECADTPLTGADTDNILAVPLRGNRIDRFNWNGTELVFERNLVKLRSFQHDAAPEPSGQNDGTQTPAGNHNGGVLRFGPDRKLYLIYGDQGRRGLMQNLPLGPTPPRADDQFGGPMPDNAHLSGVILRLNEDGTTPVDNPFYSAGSVMGGEVGANVQKVFAYGIRNSFGMAFDPQDGSLWTQENGDDSFDEINRVEPGMNGGWVQLMGPLRRIREFKSIEVNRAPGALQQLRWSPVNLADSQREVRSRMYMLPGAHYSDPEFSWRYAVAPAGIGFVRGQGLGSQFEGNLLVGASTPVLSGGYLFRFRLNGNRRRIAIDDRRLEDRVADNNAKYDITESENLLFGENFGVVTDIQTGANGNVYVVSLSSGNVYEISRR